MALYSKAVRDRFRHPRNLGELPPPCGTGQSAPARCGNAVRVTVRLDGPAVADARFVTSGCAAAIAAGSMAADLIRGRPAADALSLTGDAVALALDAPGLPCADRAAEAARNAVRDALRQADAQPKP